LTGPAGSVNLMVSRAAFLPPGNHWRTDRMKRYVCVICGYVYDPEVGDPDNDVEPGTPFENVPDDWVCPICGAEKTNFEPQEE